MSPLIAHFEVLTPAPSLPSLWLVFVAMGAGIAAWFRFSARARWLPPPIVRSEGEIRVSSDLRQDLRRRLAESAAVAMAGGVVYAVLTSVGLVRPSLTFHIIVGAALPWIQQLFALPNVLGARPLPSHTVRITDAHVTLEKYGVEYGRVSRPVILRRGRWWSPLVGDVLRGADGRLWLRPRALGAAELRTLEALLGDADPRVGTSAGT